MVCRVFGAKPLPEPTLAYCRLNLEENQNTKPFIHEDVFEGVVCEIGASLQGRFVNNEMICIEIL